MSSFTDRLSNSPLTRDLRSAVRWWAGELLRLVEDLTSRLPQKKSTDQKVIYHSGTEKPARESDTLEVAGDDDESWERLRSAIKNGREEARTVTIVVPEQLCLVRSSVYPEVADAELAGIIGLELATTTPFSAATAAWTWRRGADGKTDVVILKRDILDGIRIRADRAGLTLKEVRLASGSPKTPPFETYETPETRRNRLWNKVNVGLAAALAGLILATYGISYYQKSSAVADLKAKIAAKTGEARELRAALNRQQQETDAARSLQALKNDRTSVVETWARITRLLPRSAWVSELMLNRNGGTIVGFTGNAAALIELLEQDPALKNVTFGTAIRIDPLSKAERFDIRFSHEFADQTLAAREDGA
ncbi:MAG: PilN domain-containing protein [Pseudomonadota bacterium]